MTAAALATAEAPRGTPERARLDELEATIDRALRLHRDGEALLEIRAGKLFRFDGHRTFAAYLRERWGLSTSRGHQRMTPRRCSARS